MVRVLVFVAALAGLFVSPASLHSQERPGDTWIISRNPNRRSCWAQRPVRCFAHARVVPRPFALPFVRAPSSSSVSS